MAEFGKFCAARAGWLDSYALFSALKRKFGGKPWHEWPKPFRSARSAAGQPLDRGDLDEISAVKFGQWIFFSQYAVFRRRAGEAGVEIFGDLPIFVSLDSAEVWERPELFDLRADGLPARVAGVPPDYFSAEGQLWGNPLYDWKKSGDKVCAFGSSASGRLSKCSTWCASTISGGLPTTGPFPQARKTRAKAQ